MISVKNKRILLIGSSGVLGSEFVKALYENKANLIMSDVNNLKFNKVIKKFPDIKYLFIEVSIQSLT
jgi:FlaA1/EpsC-like NDP-sugar epimerase